MSNWSRRTLIAGIVGLVAGLPAVYWRSVYARDKRLRVFWFNSPYQEFQCEQVLRIEYIVSRGSHECSRDSPLMRALRSQQHDNKE